MRPIALAVARAVVVLAVVVAGFAVAAPAPGHAATAPSRAAPAVDWNALSDLDSIQVVTTDPSGSPRATTVWLAVWKGHGYIRSSGTRWLANLERNPDLLVRVDGEELPLRAVKVADAETREAVSQAFREKYGLTDAVIGLVRGLRGVPTILRLDPRTSLAPVD